ncbi:helix-turn-helix domain-containing protein [Anaerosporobacter faecicola]|uniref:helix-turn-helix domain-containing protein n=1 Tax=Anaerosporobacter faecicola TaxID=2718714 RepID=UPI001439A07B|nr:helix-turn-helix domain-containing protein [Anaerosporobacter faecicola]
MKDLECLQRAVEYIEENLTNKILVSEVAEYAYISERVLTELFRSIAGYPVIEYIRKRRLTRASYDLKNTEDKIIDIALKYCYESPESFSRAFRRFFGISPQQLRLQGIEPEGIGKLQFIESDVIGRQRSEGYRILENCPIYYTKEMDRIADWFRNVLGWIVNIDLRNEAGEGVYGCAMPIPEDNVSQKLTTFMGFSLFYGEALQRVIGYITVDHVDPLRNYILQSGWTKVTEILFTPWGAREFSVTTPDDGEIRFSSYDVMT